MALVICSNCGLNDAGGVLGLEEDTIGGRCRRSNKYSPFLFLKISMLSDDFGRET